MKTDSVVGSGGSQISANTYEEVAERFRAYLATQSLRMTRQREELLTAVFHAPRHFEAEDLIKTLRERQGHVSRATVYRTLSLLEECGVLRKSLFGHNRHFYESVVGRHHHDHLVCIRCGKIQEFEEPRIEEMQEQICTRYGFKILDHVHEIFGACENCQNEPTEARKH
ncbi:MAG: transcriptional repressor [Candidatus Eisenbacteria bacterium]|nr:transcriptional repressor [Candidatus Eisenbacteria bacterium]